MDTVGPLADRLGRDSSLAAPPHAVRLPAGRSGTTRSAGGAGGARRRGRATQPVERVQPAARPEGLQLGDAHGVSLLRRYVKVQPDFLPVLVCKQSFAN